MVRVPAPVVGCISGDPAAAIKAIKAAKRSQCYGESGTELPGVCFIGEEGTTLALGVADVVAFAESAAKRCPRESP